jgi:hypothetical protein
VEVECEGHDGVSDFRAQLLTDTLTTVRVSTVFFTLILLVMNMVLYSSRWISHMHLL